jgi:hypothetical protein
VDLARFCPGLDDDMPTKPNDARDENSSSSVLRPLRAFQAHELRAQGVTSLRGVICDPTVECWGDLRGFVFRFWLCRGGEKTLLDVKGEEIRASSEAALAFSTTLQIPFVTKKRGLATRVHHREHLRHSLEVSVGWARRGPDSDIQRCEIGSWHFDIQAVAQARVVHLQGMRCRLSAIVRGGYYDHSLGYPARPMHRLGGLTDSKLDPDWEREFHRQLEFGSRLAKLRLFRLPVYATAVNFLPDWAIRAVVVDGRDPLLRGLKPSTSVKSLKEPLNRLSGMAAFRDLSTAQHYFSGVYQSAPLPCPWLEQPPETAPTDAAAVRITNRHLMRMLFHGFFPVPWRQTRLGPQAVFEWAPSALSRTASEDNRQWMPDTRLQLMRRGGQLEPAWIEIDGHRVLPSDGLRDWERASRLFMTSFITAGEIDHHFARGHLLVEQYSLACMRNLVLNPVRRLLLPFLRDVSKINSFGEVLVSGESGVFAQASALGLPGVKQRLKQALGQCDWKHYRPRTPMHAQDAYAHAAGLVWAAIRQWVSAFLEGNREEILAHWAEIRALSADLRTHSTKAGEPTRLHSTVASEFRSGDDSVALSRIENMDDLGDFVCHAVFHVTFVHTWSNDRQWMCGGSVRHAPFAVLRAENGPDDPLEHELPSVGNAVFQLFIAGVLSNVHTNLLAQQAHKNPIVDLLWQRLWSMRESLAQHFLDVKHLRLTVNT